MSPRRQSLDSTPIGWMRRVLGPIFGAACLVATCTGVVVLALLLGSIVAAALQGPPEQSLVCDRRQPRRAVRL